MWVGGQGFKVKAPKGSELIDQLRTTANLGTAEDVYLIDSDFGTGRDLRD